MYINQLTFFALHCLDVVIKNVTDVPPPFVIYSTLSKSLSQMLTFSFSRSAKGRPEEPGGVRWYSDVVHQGARESHREARGELQPELAAFLSAHQAARLHAWGTGFHQKVKSCFPPLIQSVVFKNVLTNGIVTNLPWSYFVKPRLLSPELLLYILLFIGFAKGSKSAVLNHF